jgi:hypothetical protein
MFCVLVLLMAIGVVVVCCRLLDMSSLVSHGVPVLLLLYPRGKGYKEGNQVSYDMIPIRTLSLLAYFTYISIDIIIYALGSTSWFSGIFWMVGRVVADPSLGLLSPYEVVPQVLILVSSP